MLEVLRARTRDKNVLIIGVGNPLRGDDGLGPALIERLHGKVRARLLDAGDVPENYLDVINAAQAQTIIIVDAADLGAEPGDIALLELEQLADTGLTTHTASLALFARLAKSLTGADVFMLAVQPESRGFGEGISAKVMNTLDALEKILATI